jgi:Pyruvate/2-oxoacid:ferredoxin oxidoreductase gamma subunit
LPSVRVYPVPLSAMARDLGQPMVKNIIALGALAGATELFPEDTFRAALRQTLDGAPALLELNEQAFARGVSVTRSAGTSLEVPR